MNIKAIEYFEKVYQLHSFARAAKLIPISPQGLSKAIRSLESEYGVPFFDDSQGSMLPTIYGELFHVYAQQVLAAQSNLCQCIQEEKRAHVSTQLVVCCSVGISGICSHLFDIFTETYPHISLTLYEYPDFVCDEMLLKDECNLAFTVGPFNTLFQTTVLYEDIHFLWVPTKHSLSNKKECLIRDLEGETLISVGNEFKGYHGLQSLLDEQHIHLKQSRTSSEMILIERMVHEGIGLGLTVRHKANIFDFDTEVVAIPLPELPWKFGLSHLAAKPYSV